VDDPEDSDPTVFCSHLLVCHTIWYDNTNVDSGCSLLRIVVHIRPSEGQAFPFRVRRLFLFAQLSGTSAEYLVRVRFLRIGIDDEGEETTTELQHYGPWEVFIPGDNYAECFCLLVENIPFPDEGVFEFQLWIDGFDEPLGRERIQARY
jgi:hypothetical protein